MKITIDIRDIYSPTDVNIIIIDDNDNSRLIGLSSYEKFAVKLALNTALNRIRNSQLI
jgi:hypothetical protein